MKRASEWTVADERRFWSKVDRRTETECWEWRGQIIRGRYLGYGRFTIGRVKLWAHRAAWELAHGPIPSDSIVCHTCDNPPCVNPAHLFLGTHRENAHDRQAKGRDVASRARGERVAGHKLTERQVEQIRAEYKGWGSPPQHQLAAKYGVSTGAIHAVISRKNWRHVGKSLAVSALALAWILGGTAEGQSRQAEQTTRLRNLEPVRTESANWRQCRFQWMDPGTWTDREERRTAYCVLRRWPVAGGFAKLSSVISCESGWNRFAYNSGGPYVGLAQQALVSWAERLAVYRPAWWHLKPSWTNSRTMLVVTIRMAHDVGWGPWSCA